MKRWFFLVIFLTSCRATTLQAQATYYVSTTGTDSNNCANSTNVGSPWRHIRTATQCLATAGSTVLVENGTYTDPSLDVIDTNVFPAPGTSSAHMIIKCRNFRTCIIRFTSDPPLGQFAFIQKPYIEIRDFVVDGINGTQAGLGAMLKDDGSWQNGTVGDVGKGHHKTVVGVEAYNFPSNFAIVGANGQNNLGDSGDVWDNVYFHDNKQGLTGGALTINPGGYAFYLSTGNTTIQNSVFENITSIGISIYFYEAIRGDMIRNNTFRNIGTGVVFNALTGTGTIQVCSPSLDAYGSHLSDHYIYNNVFQNSGAGDLLIREERNSGYRVYNNTFYKVNTGVAGCGYGAGGGLADAGIRVEVPDNPVTLQNNLLLDNGANGINNVNGTSNVSISNSLCNTLGANNCTTANASVASSASMEFVGPSATPWPDLHLKPGAVAIGKGVNLTGTIIPPVDHDNNMRPNAPWAIGAYESTGTPPPADTPPVEDFVYTTGASLNGQNCPNGTSNCNYWTSAWTVDSGAVTTDAMSNSLTAGNAAHSSGMTAANAWRNFALTSTTGPVASNGNRLSWQARWDSSFAGGVFLNNNADNSVNVINVFGGSGGAIHVCEGQGSQFTLHTATANTSYFYEVELDAVAQAGKFRIRVTPFGGALGTFTAWTTFCNTPASPGVNRIGIYDAATTAHDFYVDSIGATATQLVFTTEPPATVNSGATFAANASVTYTNGVTPVPGATNSITLAMCPPSSGSATLTAASGLTKAAVNGTASWSDLVLTQPAGAVGLTICASASMLAGGESTTITINATAPPITSVAPARMRARVR